MNMACEGFISYGVEPWSRSADCLHVLALGVRRKVVSDATLSELLIALDMPASVRARRFCASVRRLLRQRRQLFSARDDHGRKLWKSIWKWWSGEWRATRESQTARGRFCRRSAAC